jgi:hypothetical protein
MFYFSEINSRAMAYMTIDINRRLLVRYNFINVLNTITQLNEQLPIYLMNEVREKNEFHLNDSSMIFIFSIC